MGARFMVIALMISAPCYGWLYYQHRIGLWSALWHTFVCLFLATGAGKVLGLVLHRWLLRSVPN
jgi:hypothetical protein